MKKEETPLYKMIEAFYDVREQEKKFLKENEFFVSKAEITAVLFDDAYETLKMGLEMGGISKHLVCVAGNNESILVNASCKSHKDYMDLLAKIILKHSKWDADRTKAMINEIGKIADDMIEMRAAGGKRREEDG